MVFLKYGSTGENCPYFFRTSREKNPTWSSHGNGKDLYPPPPISLLKWLKVPVGGGGFNIPLGRIGNFFHIIQLQQTIQSRYTCGANQHLSLGLLNFRASLVFLTVDWKFFTGVIFADSSFQQFLPQLEAYMHIHNFLCFVKDRQDHRFDWRNSWMLLFSGWIANFKRERERERESTLVAK